MKKILLGWILFVMSCSYVSADFFVIGLQYFHDNDILTEDEYKAVSDRGIDSTNPIRGGTRNVGTQIYGTPNDAIYSSTQAQSNTMMFIKKIFDYFLALMGAVFLGYLVYHGFLSVTAAGNDEKFRQGMNGVKYGSLALAATGVSWYVISLVFDLIVRITT